MPLVGQELMPPMDTGAVNIRLSLDSNLPLERSREVMERVNRVIIDEEKILRVSGSIGSEAGVLSIGSGGGIDQISIVATYVNGQIGPPKEGGRKGELLLGEDLARTFHLRKEGKEYFPKFYLFFKRKGWVKERGFNFFPLF